MRIVGAPWTRKFDSWDVMFMHTSLHLPPGEKLVGSFWWSVRHLSRLRLAICAFCREGSGRANIIKSNQRALFVSRASHERPMNEFNGRLSECKSLPKDFLTLFCIGSRVSCARPPVGRCLFPALQATVPQQRFGPSTYAAMRRKL